MTMIEKLIWSEKERTAPIFRDEINECAGIPNKRARIDNDITLAYSDLVNLVIVNHLTTALWISIKKTF